jgi:predicted TPR repeat methyltransferase
MSLFSTSTRANGLDDLVAALEHHRSGEFDAARFVYWKTLRHGTVDVRIPYLMACLEIHANNPEKAVDWFYKAVSYETGWGRPNLPNDDNIPEGFVGALSFDPQPVYTCHQLSLSLCARSEFQLACLALKAWLKYAPAEPRALELLGEVAAKTGDHDLAATVLAEAHRHVPNRAAIALKLGNALNRRGEPRQALAAYQKALDNDAGMCEAHINTAATLQALGRLSAAQQSISKALRIQPDHPQGLFTKANLLFESGRCDDAVQWYQKALAVAPRHAPAWLHLGHAWKQKGLLKKAVEAYRQALKFGPDDPNTSYYLGIALHALQDYAGAEKALKQSMALNPGNLSARHLLNALTGEPVSQAPLDYIEALFDRYAASFDAHMKGLLNYRIPVMMRKHLKPMSKRHGPFSRMLDIGCGTGLAGAALRDLAVKMIGVDVSRKVIDLAAAKSIYDHLICNDFVQFLEASGESFDLIVAADVFIYTGDLDRVLGLIRRRLTGSGCLAFSTEKAAHGDYHLQRSGRFAHAQPYIIRLANEHGFKIRTTRCVPVRMDNNHWINGDFFILSVNT